MDHFSFGDHTPTMRLKMRRALKHLANLRHNNILRFVVIFTGFIVVGALVELGIEGQVKGSHFDNFFQSLWFTIVTITTVGYGDMSPTTVPGKIYALVEMLVGIGMMGVVTGTVASFLVERNRMRALGLEPVKHVSGHIVICGWKAQLRDILLGILDADPALESGDLVLVTMQPPGDVGELRRERRLRNLHYIHGNHTTLPVLEMAGARRAKRIILLADETPRLNDDGIDSRTVMAATTVEAINPMVYSCTELLQPHFAQYLAHAAVEEVVLSEKNTRALIVSASLGDGLANVLERITAPGSHQLNVMDIPPDFVGKTFEELTERIKKDCGGLCIGMLEHTGNLHNRKKELLRASMRHGDYASIVKDLHALKRLSSNQPHFNPPRDERVARHTKALVLAPGAAPQPPEEIARRKNQFPQARDPRPEQLLICGWKRNMSNLLVRIVNLHAQNQRKLTKVVVLGDLPPHEVEAIHADPHLKQVEVVLGEATLPQNLIKAGIGDTTRALVLTTAAGQRDAQENDARNVLITYAIHELNRYTYKCVEVTNPEVRAHLKMANVEEVIYTSMHQRWIMVQGALGTGLTTAMDLLTIPLHPQMRVMDFPPGPPGQTFAGHARALAAKNMLLAGVIEHAGNYQHQKDTYIHQARVEAKIADSINHLMNWKDMVNNHAILHPGDDYVPGNTSRAVVILQNSSVSLEGTEVAT